MTYSAAELLMLVTGICAGFGGMVVAIITAWRTGAKVEESAKKTDGKVDVVHELVNDRATKQDALNKELQSQVRVLIATIARYDQKRAIDEDRVSREQSVEQGSREERQRVADAAEVSIESDVKTLRNDVVEVKGDVKQVKKEVLKEDE